MTSTTRCSWLARCANMATHTVYTGPSAGTVPACDSCHPEPWPHALGYPCPRPESCDRPECLENPNMPWSPIDVEPMA